MYGAICDAVKQHILDFRLQIFDLYINDSIAEEFAYLVSLREELRVVLQEKHLSIDIVLRLRIFEVRLQLRYLHVGTAKPSKAAPAAQAQGSAAQRCRSAAKAR